VVRLFVASDENKTVVALARPDVSGRYQSEAIGSIVTMTAVGYAEAPGGSDVLPRRNSTIDVDTPGRAGSDIVPVVTLIVAVVFGVVLSVALTPWLGVPVGLAIMIAGVWRTSLTVDHVREQWAGGHHVLNSSEEIAELHAAVRASNRIVELWPQLASVTGVADPRHTLAHAVWDLSAVLADREALRATLNELWRNIAAVPTENRVHGELVARREIAQAKMAELDADIARRRQHLEAFAQKCQGFVAEQEAVRHGQQTVRDADRILGSMVPQAGRPEDSSEEFAANTTAVLLAYRELTNDLDLG
jgi:hypothetical protein